MNKYRIGLSSIILALLARPASAQDFAATAGLGLEYYNAPSLSQYILNRAGGVTPGTYMTAVQLGAGIEYFVLEDWTLGIEYGYITNQSNGNGYQISYSYSMPTIMLRRALAGDNYYIRFGGGIGYHSFTMSQTDPYGGKTDYSTKGVGLKFDVAFDTKLSEDFYVRVEGDARAEYTGNFKAKDLDTTEQNEPTYNSDLSGVGVTFGLVYYF